MLYFLPLCHLVLACVGLLHIIPMEYIHICGCNVRKCEQFKGYEETKIKHYRLRDCEWTKEKIIRKQKQMKTPTQPPWSEREKSEAATVLMGKMAAKHLTRVLFLSALSSAISSSLSRSCSRQTFSSLVNTANSCETHTHTDGSQKHKNKQSGCMFVILSK